MSCDWDERTGGADATGQVETRGITGVINVNTRTSTRAMITTVACESQTDVGSFAAALKQCRLARNQEAGGEQVPEFHVHPTDYPHVL